MAGVSAKNSYNTSVRCGNWYEDSWGQRHASNISARHAAATWEVPSHARDYVMKVGDVKIASAPMPIDAIDGHLVMAHGTNIIERIPETGHYMSLNAGAAAGITPQEMLNVHAHPTIGRRTELIAHIAKQVSYGILRGGVAGRINASR